MRISFLVFLILLLSHFNQIHAQSVGIGITNPNSSAKLDVSSSNQGLLPPRMTFSQRNAINNPASGLIIYCTTCGNGGDLQVFSNGSWKSMTNQPTADSITQPILVTNEVSAITSSTAVSGGIITSSGGLPIISRGVVWSLSNNPGVELSTKTIDGSGIGSFSSTMTGLTNNTSYHVRAYAITIGDTAYGNDITFNTSEMLPNTSIVGLKTYHTIPGAYDLITENVIISGIVTANDKTGNFYKQLFIQDSTGAMQILLNKNNLYEDFPVGRKVFVKCSGLTISDNYGTLVLGVKVNLSGVTSLLGILSNEINQYLIGGSFNNPVEAIPVDISELGTSLNNRYINALVRLSGYEVDAADTLKTYSDTSNYHTTQNRSISTGCGSTVKPSVRTNGYANFAGVQLPRGNGSITSIYTIYKPISSITSKYLMIRDTSDIQFTGARCGEPPLGSITLLNENFETQTANSTVPYVPVTITDWQNNSEVGAKKFDARIFNSNKYANLSGFGTNNGDIKTWLVTKGINLDATINETLTFETKQDFYMSSTTGGGFPVPSDLQILISNNYTGIGNPWASEVTWTDVTAQATLSPGSTTSNYPTLFTASGAINLSSYSGTIYIAFKYSGFDNTATTAVPGDKTSAWEIDNIKVVGN